MSRAVFGLAIACVLSASASFGAQVPGAPWLMVDEVLEPDPPPQEVGTIEKYGDPDESWAELNWAGGEVVNRYPYPSRARAELEYGRAEAGCSAYGGVDVLDGRAYTKYTLVRDPDWEDPPVTDTWSYSGYLSASLSAEDELASCWLSGFWLEMVVKRPGQGVLLTVSWDSDLEDPADWGLDGPGAKAIYREFGPGPVEPIFEELDTVEMEVNAGELGARTEEQQRAEASLGWFEFTTTFEHAE